MKRFLYAILIALGLGITAFGALAVLYPSALTTLLYGRGQAIAAVPPSTLPNRLLTDQAHFRQDAPEWAADTLGGTNDTLAAYGCTLTSVANAISNMGERPISPKALNTAMGDKGGYTSRGWLIWAKIKEATDGQYEAQVHSSPSHDAIEACMADQAYPVIKIMLGGVVPHWVVLTGRKDGEYMMRDPLKGGPDTGSIPVSSRSSKIHSLRCIRPAT